MIRRWLLPAIAVVWTLVLTVPARAQQFELGDVIVSGSIPAGGTQQFRTQVLWYGRDGQLKKVLVDSEAFSSRGLGFSPGGILHTISGGGLVTISPSGTIARLLVNGFYASFAFAADATFLAGYDGGVLNRFSPSGSLVRRYAVSSDVATLDLASDQCTVYYLGPGVKRFDVCQGTQLPDFLPVDGVDFRLLAGGGLAISRPVTDGVEIYNSSGTVLRRIPAFAGKLALDVGGTSLWLAMQGGSLVKFDIATGNQLLGPIQTGLPRINGLAVYGEPRAALVNGPLTAIPALSPSMLLMLGVALAVLAMLRLRM